MSADTSTTKPYQVSKYLHSGDISPVYSVGFYGPPSGHSYSITEEYRPYGEASSHEDDPLGPAILALAVPRSGREREKLRLAEKKRKKIAPPP